ncbi:MAG: hypothetical protein K2F81_01660 [Ruminococcus sp.]|nr:hypothetical protein [Ruminococcus sp.]
MKKYLIFKNRKFKIISIILLIYLLFATVVLICFYSIRNNPTDKIAMPYVWNDKDFQNQYGEISSVCRYHGYETKKTEKEMKVPYVVETKNYNVYVILQKNDDDWDAVSLDILDVKEVQQNVNKT